MAAKVYGTLTLSDAPFQETYPSTSHSPQALAPHGDRGRFRLGLCPVHSPLLGASLLLSFPALSDMLKFSA